MRGNLKQKSPPELIFKIRPHLLRKVLFLGLISIATYNTQLWAQAQQLTGPTAAAMGRAGVAAAEASEGIFLNPAMLVHGKEFESGFIYQDGYEARQTHKQTMGLSLVDNSPDIFLSGGFAYLQGGRTHPLLPGTVQEKLIQGSAARFAFRQLALGASLKYLESAIRSAKDYEQWNADVGLHWAFHPDAALGISYYNVARNGRSVPLAIRLLPEWRVGVHWILLEFLRGRLDFSRPDQENPQRKGRIHTGLQAEMAEWVSLRLGALFDDVAGRNFLTGGLGFDGPKLKINYSFEKPLRGTNGALHTVDFRVAF